MKFKGLLAVAALMVAPVCQAAMPVLIYHRISDRLPPGETVVSLTKFNRQMEYLAAQGYTTLSIDELVAGMQGKRPPPQKSIVITFDDGWRDVLSAVPTLNKHGFKASFWIITQSLRDTENGQRFSVADIKKLAENPRFDVQAHSVTHPWDQTKSTLLRWAEGRTPGKGPADVRYELTESKRVLETVLRRPVDYFAWPLGEYNDMMIQMAKEAGYKALLTIDNRAPNVVGGDVFKIKRMYVDGTCGMKSFITQLADFSARNCFPEEKD